MLHKGKPGILGAVDSEQFKRKKLIWIIVRTWCGIEEADYHQYKNQPERTML